MGKKSDALYVELAFAKSMIGAILEELGIDFDRQAPVTDDVHTRALRAFWQSRLAAKGEVCLTSTSEQPAEAGPSAHQVSQEQPQDGDPRFPSRSGDAAFMVSEEPTDAGPVVSVQDGLDDDERIEFLRASLADRSDALSTAHAVLNRITAAAGVDRWTPDGHQIVDKLNKLSTTTLNSVSKSHTAKYAKSARLSLDEVINEIAMLDLNENNDRLRPLSESGGTIKQIRALVVSAIASLENLP